MKTSVSLVIALFALGILFSACPNDTVESPYPDCMQSTIDSILAMPVLNPPGRIDEWIDQNDTYYYVSGGCCDFFNYLYDESCARICAADGGITGEGDGNCPTFSDDIVKTNLWEDTRK